MPATLRQRLRRQQGQASLEYAGIAAAAALVVVALVVAAPGLGSAIGCGVEQAVAGVTGAGAGSCGDEGASAGNEGTGAADDVSEPLPPGSIEVIEPEELEPPTEDDFVRPWERVDMSEEEWRELERTVIDEACPGGWQEALAGCPIIGLTWDEDGELAPIEIQEMGVGSGLLRLLTRAKPVLSVPRALGQAITRIPLALKNKLVAAGILRSPGARLPPYTGGKTQGVLDLGTRELSLISGRTGYAQGIPTGTPGFNAYFRTHVEGHAVAYMRQNGIREATVYINQTGPCAGTCMRMIPRALPEGYVLRVVGSDGRIFVFRGVAPG
jgi:Flp pilus assembly pilin Flp